MNKNSKAYIGQTVRYLGGRINYKVTEVHENGVSMVRADGKDGGKPITVGFYPIGLG